VAPLSVDFTATFGAQDGSACSADWVFSDGSTSTGLDVPKTLAPGRYSGRLTVTDGQGLTCTDSVSAVGLGVGGTIPPMIVSTPTATSGASCGVPYTYVPVAAGPGPLTWSLSRTDGAALPPSVVFDSSTGSITWTPHPGDVGAIPLRLTASNGSSVDSQLLNLDVSCGPPMDLGVGCACSTGTGGSGAAALLALLALARALRVRRSA
jgi:MYXO-CTERM domain-containing protein